MTAAVVILGLAVLSLSVGLIASLAWARGALDARVKAQEEKLGTERKCLDLEDDRDAALARAVKAEAEASEAKKAGAIHEAAAKAAREELIKHVREKLATGSDDDVASEVDRLLGVALSEAAPVSDVSTSPASDHRSPP
jgi:hypothetical protein